LLTRRAAAAEVHRSHEDATTDAGRASASTVPRSRRWPCRADTPHAPGGWHPCVEGYLRVPSCSRWSSWLQSSSCLRRDCTA
jgi:hypothetical protein